VICDASVSTDSKTPLEPFGFLNNFRHRYAQPLADPHPGSSVAARIDRNRESPLFRRKAQDQSPLEIAAETGLFGDCATTPSDHTRCARGDDTPRSRTLTVSLAAGRLTYLGLLFILGYARIAVMFPRLRSAGLVLSSGLLHLTRSIGILRTWRLGALLIWNLGALLSAWGLVSHVNILMESRLMPQFHVTEPAGSGMSRNFGTSRRPIPANELRTSATAATSAPQTPPGVGPTPRRKGQVSARRCRAAGHCPQASCGAQCGPRMLLNPFTDR
jgi:hypothetical protein